MLAALAGCSRAPAIQSCADDLSGVWRAELGPGAVSPTTARGQPGHWAVLDAGSTLAAYPLFADAPRGGADIVAPRVIELVRERGVIAGAIHRRVMRGADACDARAAVVITRCAGDDLELELADPPLPLGVAPCAWPATPNPHHERWRRQ